MKNIRLIKLLYLAITIISLLCVCVTNTSIYDIFSGISYMWICFLCLFLAYKWGKNPSSIGIYVPEKKLKSPLFYPVVSVLIWCFVIIVAKFYTGQMPWNVAMNIRSGVSNYYIYQKYFAVENIASMGIRKLPYVLMNFVVQFLFIYSFVHCLIVERSRKKYGVFLVCISLAKLYFGLARGTNFEMFEVAFVIIYCYWNNTKQGMRIKEILKIGIGILFCVGIFSIVVAMRGETSAYVKISEGIYTDQMKVLPRYLPAISKIIALVSAYFAFGIYNISYYFNTFFVDSLEKMFYGIIPFGNLGIKESIPTTTNSTFLNSVCWTPDIMRLISVFGVLACPFVMFLLGRILKIVDCKGEKDKRDDLLEIIKFYCVYEIFSLPIGSFIGTASNSKLVIAWSVCFLFVKIYRNEKKYI